MHLSPDLPSNFIIEGKLLISFLKHGVSNEFRWKKQFCRFKKEGNRKQDHEVLLFY